MALLDHFHPPLSGRRHWHSFHNHWASALAAELNERLPERFFAEPHVQFGIEVDVRTLEEAHTDAEGGEAAPWRPPAPVQTLPFARVTDSVEVRVFATEQGPTLVGALELVSPANKDREEHRNAFLAKCQAYLQNGVGLVVVDVVTSRRANLHEALLEQLGGTAGVTSDLYAAAYRVVERGEEEHALDVWEERLSLGAPLPELPLCLRSGPCLPVALESTYARACRELRLPAAG